MKKTIPFYSLTTQGRVRAGQEVGTDRAALNAGAERAPGFFRGNPLNMKSVPVESTSQAAPLSRWPRGSAPNLHLSLCPHPGREASRYWSLQNMLRVLKDFPFSIPFPGCAPSEMSKAAQNQAGMAPVGVLGAGGFCFSLEEFSPRRVAKIQ